MSPRARRTILISILILLALLLAFLLWWFLRPEPTVTPVVAPLVVQPVQVPPRETITEIEREQEQETRTQTASLQSASKTFAERYGSYSTEAEFANLRDVLPLMTSALARQTKSFVDGATPAAEYYAVTTRVISLEVDAVDEAEGTAQVTVTTQREEARIDIQNVAVRYQDLVLAFAMEDGTWKVSSATWR